MPSLTPSQANQEAQRVAVHIFRRDLRLYDNTALVEASRDGYQVLPCFIFDPAQIERHAYFSPPGFQYLIESLQSLRSELAKLGAKLFIFEGRPHEVIERLIAEKKVVRVCVNRDYTPFSIERDRYLETVCQRHGISFESYHDALLAEPGKALTQTGAPFTVFTPFYKSAIKNHPVAPPMALPDNVVWSTDAIAWAQPPDGLKTMCPALSANLFTKGGRAEALRRLKRIANLGSYKEDRNVPSLGATTGLSAAHKFGVVSIRETYAAAKDAWGADCHLISELYWRDFFTHLAFHYPHVFTGSFNEKLNALRWENDETKFSRWCEGQTGFPIVDAGIRELNATGYMHNRVRMITASFLVKDLHIDWRWGERYFAQHLIDYDPCVNNGSWQWSASTGADAAPYFRIFNPWSQQLKFDPECEYIRQWVDELRGSDAQDIHGLSLPLMTPPRGYPRPMLDHKAEAAKALHAFQRLKTNESK